MGLLLFFLVSYYPYKMRDGALMVILMFGYGIHRFLNEMLRIDNEVVAFGLTLSQNISVGVLIAAVILAVLIWRRPSSAGGLVNTASAGLAKPQAEFNSPPVSTTSS